MGEQKAAVPSLDLVVEHAVVHSYPLPGGEYIIGRGDEADIQLLDGAVSGRHAVVTVTESEDFPGYFDAQVEDAGSRNGTKVNDRDIDTCPLSHDDMLKIGRTVLRYVDPNGEVSRKATAVVLPEDD
ncbi:MAG: FHA domain-containing protein [Xanthomonadales bacterium]|nr:FHA domain-containing protein [Xanthomonadales bacterium]